MLLFVWLALSPCLRKWGKKEYFVGSWRFPGGRWASSPRDRVSRRIISCSWLLSSVLVWSPLFWQRRSGLGWLVLGCSPPAFHALFCHDFTHAEIISLLFVSCFVYDFWLDNGRKQAVFRGFGLIILAVCFWFCDFNNCFGKLYFFEQFNVWDPSVSAISCGLWSCLQFSCCLHLFPFSFFFLPMPWRAANDKLQVSSWWGNLEFSSAHSW